MNNAREALQISIGAWIFIMFLGGLFAVNPYVGAWVLFLMFVVAFIFLVIEDYRR